MLVEVLEPFNCQMPVAILSKRTTKNQEKEVGCSNVWNHECWANGEPRREVEAIERCGATEAEIVIRVHTLLP
jgi:hypothetical protein